MPSAPRTLTSIREARIFARREYGPAPLQTRFSPERSLPSSDLPLQTVYSETLFLSGPAIPPSLHESASRSQLAKIPKPPGDVSRIARGGYSLSGTLRWDTTTYKAFQDAVAKAAASLPQGLISTQEEKALKSVYDVVREQFPKLDEYQDDWPIRDYLSVHLKNRQRTASGEVEDAAEESELTELEEPTNAKGSKKSGAKKTKKKVGNVSSRKTTK